ncbi:hypothetical protein GCM10023237_35030 [Streptomyces coeruleoprunus]
MPSVLPERLADVREQPEDDAADDLLDHKTPSATIVATDPPPDPLFPDLLGELGATR